jgi:sensor histidine kinase regulating citrate/malate metabolism
MEQLMLYAKENERLVNELRDFKHYTLNIIHGINCCIELEDWDGLKKYFYEILENYKHIIDTNLSSIEKIKNSSLKVLLSAKLKSAVSKNINFKVMADDSILIGNDIINENDLCKVINEFLDNAIESASEASIKKVSIYFLTNENSTNIIIENTFKEKPNMSLLEVESSTEGKGRRLGLQSINTILSRYPHILNNIFVQHQVLVQELQILK